MKKMFSIGFAFALWPSIVLANVQQDVDRLINQVDPAINIGIEVLDLTTGKMLYSRNANRPFTPASNMKIFSDAAALMLLGPDYRFKNQLSTDASELKQGVLKGNIYLHLPGDPSFSHETLQRLFNTLSQWKIKRIQGDVVIHSSSSAISPYAPGWMLEDLPYSYGAPIAPVIVDTNRLTFTVNPAAKAGQEAIVELIDASGSIQLDNKILTRPGSKGCGIDFSMDKDNRLALKGCIGIGQWAIQQGMAIRNPLIYLQGLIQNQLTQSGIHLVGKIRLGKAPQDGLLLASASSNSLAQLLADTLKPSDNLYAESLFLHTAARLQKAPVNWHEAKNLIRDFLQKQTGIDLQTAVLHDGSGLSRYDLLTPRQTVKLLKFLYEKFPFSYEFIAALPVSGRDGTLQRRFLKPGQQDLLRGKTGTMKGVISLSGYLYAQNGHTLAFATYINNLPGTRPAVSGRYRYLVDAISNYFLQHKLDLQAVKPPLASARHRSPFQQQPTWADLQRRKQGQWRRLETQLKQALKNQPVTVIFRNNELVLKDYQKDASNVWSVMQGLNKKYAFTVALTSKQLPRLEKTRPRLLWVYPEPVLAAGERIWILRPAVS